MRTLLLLASGLLLACGAAHAVDEAAAIELAKNNGCLSCHSAKEKVVGPAYSSVAEKYKDDKDAVANLVQSIQYGSKGKWGRIPMPPHPSMSAADIKTLAQWVMSTKP
jgi:cytochrome c